MIIDKVAPYYTEEDKKTLKELSVKQIFILHRINEASEAGATDKEIEIILEEWNSVSDEQDRIRDAIEDRYIKGKSKSAILKDIKEIVGALEQEDFKNGLLTRIQHISSLQAHGAPEETIEPLKKYTLENYENCYSFILDVLKVQLKALGDDETSFDKARAIIEKKVVLWYMKPHPAYLPMVHGKPTDALAYMTSKNAIIDRVTGDARIDKYGVEATILKLKSLKGDIGINTDKLLSYALQVFTDQNDFRHTKGKVPRRDVSIPLRDYAQDLGYDVEEHETSTPEEAERERKRAKNQLDNARKAVKQALEILYACSFGWQEVIKGKPRDFGDTRLLTSKGIENGMIKLSFTPEMASYLAMRNTITYYPTAQYRIPAKYSTAYYIGKKLAEYYYIDNNQIQGTHDRLSIPKLLEYSGLQSYEEVQATDRGHWEKRIKDPLEEALETLIRYGVLRSWEYTHAKGVPLTEEEAYSITTYEDFSKLYIHFDLANPIDHTERIGKRIEALEKRKAKTGVKRRRKKPADKKEG